MNTLDGGLQDSGTVYCYYFPLGLQTRVWQWCVLVLASVAWCPDPVNSQISSPSSKQQVGLVTLVPSQPFLQRAINNSFKNAIAKANRIAQVQGQRVTLVGEIILMNDDMRGPQQLLDIICELVSNRSINSIFYLSLFDHSGESSASAQYVMKMTDIVGLPVLAVLGDNPSNIQADTGRKLIRFTPSIVHHCEAILAILARYNWVTFAIVMTRLMGHDNFANVLRARAADKQRQGGKNFNVVATLTIDYLDDDFLVSFQLEKLREAECTVFVLYASSNEANIIFEAASAMDLTTNAHMWILASVVVGDWEQPSSLNFPPGTLGVISFTNTYTGLDQYSKSVVEQVVEVWSSAVMDFAKSINVSQSSNVTLYPAGGCYAENLMEWPYADSFYQSLLRTKTGSVRPDGTRQDRFDKNGIMVDVDVKVLNLNEQHKWDTIGQWKSATGTLELDDIVWPGSEAYPPSGRPNKYKLRVVTIQERPYVVYNEMDNKTKKCPPQAEPCLLSPAKTPDDDIREQGAHKMACCSGLCIDILHMLADDLGFELDLFEVPDQRWGAYNKDTKEWNGLIRTIMDKKADMIVTSIKINPERSEQIAFSIPFLETGISIIVAIRAGVVSPTAFLEPYDTMSWIFIFLVCINVVTVCLFVLEWLSPNGLGSNAHQPDEKSRFSLCRGYWLMWVMLFGAAVEVVVPRSMSARVLASFWALFAVMFSASYTANLAAFMITREEYDKFSGIQDPRLVEAASYFPPPKFGTVIYGSTETIIEKNYPSMFRYMRQYNRSTIDDGIKSLIKGELNAFLYDATVLEFRAAQDDKCQLRTVGKWFAMTGYGIGFPKNSRWINPVNALLAQYQENGALERLQKLWLSGVCKTTEGGGGDEQKSNALGVINFTSAFMMLGCGVMFSLFIMLAEHVYFMFGQKIMDRLGLGGCCHLISVKTGQMMSMADAVAELAERQKSFTCKNVKCGMKLWTLNHRLDLAQLKIRNLLQGSRGSESRVWPILTAVNSRGVQTGYGHVDSSKYDDVDHPTLRHRTHGNATNNSSLLARLILSMWKQKRPESPAVHVENVTEHENDDEHSGFNSHSDLDSEEPYVEHLTVL